MEAKTIKAKLKHVCKIEKGKIGITRAVDGDYPLVVTAEERLSHKEWHFNEPATIVPLVSSTGHGHASIKRLHYEEGKYAVGNILAVLTPKNKELLNAKYLYLFLTYHKEDLLVSQMCGAANVSLSLSKLREVTIEIPAIGEQLKAVNRYEAILNLSNKLEDRLSLSQIDLERLLLNFFKERIRDVEYKSMAEVAPIIRRKIPINPGDEYPELGIRSFGRGTFHKPAIKGSHLGSKKIYQILPDDSLFNNVFAWEGAIAVVQEIDRGRYGSHRFISCVCKKDVMDPTFLYYYFLTDEGLDKIRKASPGSTSRNKTLGLEKLERIEVPVPQITLQREFTELFNRTNLIRDNSTIGLKKIEFLVQATLREIFDKEQ